MKNDNLIYPDERGDLNPYSLICVGCGNVEMFFYDEIKRTLITIRDGIVSFDFGHFVQKNTGDSRVAIVVKKHMETGAGIDKELEIIRDEIYCANPKCRNSSILLYGDILTECQSNRCIGCFKCGGAYNKESIMDNCIKCIDYRKSLFSDSAMFMITLDMDLFCDACPIQAIREEYGFTSDDARAIVSGKLKS